MSTRDNPIAATLVAARHQAGLSQRALSTKAGLAQSHLSKIERGAIDPQVSSLLEVARTLGLELMLVPVPFVPAVQALLRESLPDPRRTPAAIDRDLSRLTTRARRLARQFPDLQALADLGVAADELRLLRPDESSATEVRSLTDSARAILTQLPGAAHEQPTQERAATSRAVAEALAPIARNMWALRDAWGDRSIRSRQSPAYRLDDSDA